MRAAAEVYGRDCQRFVHRHDEVAGTVDAAARAERRRDRFAQRDSGILDGVMLIDVEVARGMERQIERPVTGDELEHVIQEADAG